MKQIKLLLTALLFGAFLIYAAQEWDKSRRKVRPMEHVADGEVMRKMEEAREQGKEEAYFTEEELKARRPDPPPDTYEVNGVKIRRPRIRVRFR